MLTLMILVICSWSLRVHGVAGTVAPVTETQTACSPSPCSNGGSCVPGDTPDTFTCNCPPGYTGDLCATAISPSSTSMPRTTMNTPTTSLTFDCDDEYAASLLWTQSAEANDGFVRYPCPRVDRKLNGGKVSRRCDPETQRWGDIDFSECTVGPAQPVFVILWLTLNTGNEQLVNNRRPGIEMDISNQLGLNRTTTRVSVTSVITQSQGDIPYTVITVSVDYLQLTQPTQTLTSTLPELLPSLMTSEPLGGIAVSSDGSFGYQGFFLSGSCLCQPSGILFAGLCINEVPFAPCTCRNGQCRCFSPYFVGDNVSCTLDSDGDGYPDARLPTCNNQTATQRYCIMDNCVEIFNPEQDLLPCVAPPDFVGCRRQNDPQWDITWGNTPPGETDRQRCPVGNGFATRKCTNSGWMRPNVMQCDTYEFMSIRESADSIFNEGPELRPLRDRLADTAELAGQVLELTSPGPSASILPVDLNSTNAVIDGIVSLLDQTLDTTENVTDIPNQSLLDIFSNVLDGRNLDGWVTLQDFDAGSQKLLDNAERYALYLAEALDDDDNQRRLWQTENMVISFLRRDPETDLDDVKFPQSLSDLSNTSYEFIPAEITLPPSLFKERRKPGKRSASISSVIFRNMEAALPDRINNGTFVASMILSTQVGQRGSVSQSLQTEPVGLTFTFDKVNSSTNYKCAYWKFSDPIGDGGWAFDGIEMTSMSETDDGKMVVSCSATHLTSFAVLVDVAGSLSNQNTTTELLALKFISYIGCGVSIACLLVAIVFFLALGRELFTKVHYFIHLNLSISLCLAYFTFVAGIEKATAYEASCIFVAALLHYLFLCVFCWMLCEGIMLYLMLVLVFSKLSKKWWIFLVIGYGLPLIPLAVTLGARYYEYGVRDSSGQLLFCWLPTDQGVIWAFVGPMLAVIAVNVVFMVIALVTVFRSKRGSIKRNKSMKRLEDNHKPNLDLFKTLFVASLVLLPVLGVTWVLGIFAVNSNTTVFAWLFTIINSLQGVFILIFHVLRSDKVLKSSRARRLHSRASSTFRSFQTRGTSLSLSSKSVKKPPSSFVSSTYESSTKGTILSSIAEDGESESQLQTNGEKVPWDNSNGKELENGTETNHTFQ